MQPGKKKKTPVQKCGKCRFLVPQFCLCTNPKFKNLPPKLLIKCEHGFIRRPECIEKPKRENKYKAEKVDINGEKYDSKAEYDRFLQLSIAQKAGKIANLKHHKKYIIVPKSKYGGDLYYEADFVYNLLPSMKVVVEDVKCEVTKTKSYALKKRLVAEQYGIVIKEVMI